MEANCIILDIDNNFSELSDDWKSEAALSLAFPRVAYAIHKSRNHLKEKNGKAARPRFHVILPIDPIFDGKEYRALKKWAF